MQQKLQEPPAFETAGQPLTVPTRIETAEFTAAINRIEARRAHETAQATGNVNVEQTIRELRIDASPDEVLREVAAIRAESDYQARQRQTVESERLLAKRTRRKRISWRIAAAFALVLTGAGIQYGTDLHNADELATTMTRGMQLNSLQDGQGLFLSSDNLQTLISEGGSLSNLNAASLHGTTAQDSSHLWSVVRHGNAMWLYDFVDAGDTKTATGTRHVYAYTDRADPSRPIVPIPLTGVVSDGIDSDSIADGQEITLANKQ